MTQGGPSLLERALAWSVHVLTASGVAWGFLALEAGGRGAWREAFAWLMVATLVDAVDGPLARRLRVKEVVPGFDGALLDNLVDYLNYVIVPAILLDGAALLPASFSFGGAVGISLASAYQFCNRAAKTPDGYFTGFPSYWNIVVFYLLALGLSEELNLAIVATLAALVFAPIRHLHPNRTVRFRRLTLALTAAWIAAVLAILLQLPAPDQGLVWGSLLYVAYYFGMSVFQMIRPIPTQQ